MKIIVLAGGTSTEREVSLNSGKMVCKALRSKGHQAVMLDVFMGYDSHNPMELYHVQTDVEAAAAALSGRMKEIEKLVKERKERQESFFGPNVLTLCKDADIVFMALHGQNGEDGKIQAAFDLLGIPYTGAGYLGSALAMDKGLSKQIFLHYHVPTPKSVLFTSQAPLKELPFAKGAVVKPCCGGSSVGVAIAKTQSEYDKALEAAFALEKEVLVEEYVSELIYVNELRPFEEKLHPLDCNMEWSEFKLGPDGLVPVVVQDYRTDEVLMAAYMNEEAFQKTIETGKMTYWSRSRQELWVKGLTSGHFQYVKELVVDCDLDTILAKVSQTGAACHTGNKSCFFHEIAKTDYKNTNPLKVFEQVYEVIADRKAHPKEGSYTNYLFEKGIDKILKKVGEEATELVIAAKNPDPEEIKYEMSDLLYHAMVLMVERGVTWEDITAELANR